MAFFQKILQKLGRNKTARTVAKKLNLSASTLSKLSDLSQKKKSKADSLRDIEKKVDDLNFKLDLILDHFISAKDAKPASGELANRQCANNEILFEFDKICKENSISYWLDFGTLLGAKRHSGCIPWDDDVDVAMLESDFEKLKLCKSNFNENIKLDLDCEIGRVKSEKGIMDIFVYVQKDNRLKTRNFFSRIKNFNFSIPKNVVFPLEEIEYSNKLLSCPHNTDLYLRARYGNYELLPKHKSPYDHGAINERIIFYPEENK